MVCFRRRIYHKSLPFPPSNQPDQSKRRKACKIPFRSQPPPPGRPPNIVWFLNVKLWPNNTSIIAHGTPGCGTEGKSEWNAPWTTLLQHKLPEDVFRLVLPYAITAARPSMCNKISLPSEGVHCWRVLAKDRVKGELESDNISPPNLDVVIVVGWSDRRTVDELSMSMFLLLFFRYTSSPPEEVTHNAMQFSAV